MSFRGRVRGGLDQPLARHEERVPGNRVRQQRRRAMRLRVRRISTSESGLDPTFYCLTPAGYRPLRSETSSLALANRTTPWPLQVGGGGSFCGDCGGGICGTGAIRGIGGAGGGGGGGAPPPPRRGGKIAPPPTRPKHRPTTPRWGETPPRAAP